MNRPRQSIVSVKTAYPWRSNLTEQVGGGGSSYGEEGIDEGRHDHPDPEPSPHKCLVRTLINDHKKEST